jgi:hypothetical protein
VHNRSLAQKTREALDLIMDLLKEILLFLKEEKKLWMAPIFLLMILFGSVIVAVEGSAVLPFIYAIF